MRECPDDNPKIIQVEFNGGILNNDEIQLCANCFSQHPFNKQIISKVLINKNTGFQKQNPDSSNQPTTEGFSN